MAPMALGYSCRPKTGTGGAAAQSARAELRLGIPQGHPTVPPSIQLLAGALAATVAELTGELVLMPLLDRAEELLGGYN